MLKRRSALWDAVPHPSTPVTTVCHLLWDAVLHPFTPVVRCVSSPLGPCPAPIYPGDHSPRRRLPERYAAILGSKRAGFLDFVDIFSEKLSFSSFSHRYAAIWLNIIQNQGFRAVRCDFGGQKQRIFWIFWTLHQGFSTKSTILDSFGRSLEHFPSGTLRFCGPKERVFWILWICSAKNYPLLRFPTGTLRFG